nr:hexamerin 2 [Limnephilus flavicornis]
MKFLFLCLVSLAVANANKITDSLLDKDVGFGDYKLKTMDKDITVDKEFIFRNKNILRLLSHVHTLNNYKDQAMIGKEWHFEANYDKFTNVLVVKDFIKLLKTGLLPKYKIFTITNDKHRDEVVALFHLFYYAKDFETFYKVACWARDYVNEGMFVYAMTVAVIHRMDTRGMKLPPPYEIYPFYFFNTEVIEKAMILKMKEVIVDTKLADYYGVYKKDDTFYIKSNYSGWYTTTNEENKLTYFTEDIDLNTYYFYFHASYPFWMNSEEFGLVKDRKGELFLYTHQQLLARYNLERLSNDMDEIPKFMWTKDIKTGFKSSLKHHNGMVFPSRPNDFNLFTEDKLYDLTEVDDYERRIRDAVVKGFIMTEDGKMLSLKKPEDIEKLGNMIQANKDCVNTRYYLLGVLTAKKLLGNGDDVKFDYMTNPTILETYETALRDPMFYQLTKRFLFNFMLFKDMLKPYTHDELIFPGVKMVDVSVDKLITFFDKVDVDITNAVYRKGDEMDEVRDKFMFKVIQKRLNHHPFDVKLDIISDKTTDAVVRIFLGPKFDFMKKELTMDMNKENFIEMDKFVYKLKTGKNIVVRNSRDFMTTIGDRTPAIELHKKFTTIITGNEDVILDKTNTFIGFPDRLLLPKGKMEGMLFKVYVVITPLHVGKTFGVVDNLGKLFTDVKILKDKDLKYDFFTNKRIVDDVAFGFPLDRPINMIDFWVPNMMMKEVKIFHKTDINTSKKYLDKDHVTDFDKDTYKTFDDKFKTGMYDTDTYKTDYMGKYFKDDDTYVI